MQAESRVAPGKLRPLPRPGRPTYERRSNRSGNAADAIRLALTRAAKRGALSALILVDECVDPFSTEAVRASMGALFTVPIVRVIWPEFLTWLREGPGQLVGLSLQTDNGYRDAPYAAPTFLLTGNEAQGLPEEYEAECDLLVKMPMLGKADSLNAAVATAVMAYEVLARHR